MATQEDISSSPCSSRPTARRAASSWHVSRGDHEARHHRRPAPRDQARPASDRPVLRHAIAGQREGGRAVRGQSLQRHAPAPLQPRRDPAGAGPGAVHQRAARRHLRAEEQPDQADGRGRRRAVPARPRSAREALRVRPLRRPFRGGRARGALLHAPHGQGLLVPALQPGLERWRGNPPNPDGLKTDYLWKRILTRDGLTDILENYAQIVETKDPKTGKKKAVQIWPRYHQLDVVRQLLADAQATAPGERYLIQHSAGSGKSNSIAWLAHQMIGLKKDDAPSSTRSSSSPTGASSTSRSATRSSSSPRSAPPSDTPSTPATCASSSPRGRRSSSPRCRSSRSSSTRSATSTAGGSSRSSSTRRIRARGQHVGGASAWRCRLRAPRKTTRR